jgi:hypothetical protein
MKVVAWLMTAVNLLFGLRAAFSAATGDSKYSIGMTWLAGLLFLALGGYAVWALLGGKPARTALWSGVAPWLTLVVVMFIQLVVGDRW